ncbi:hypothetical protein [Nostoc sp.]|uniref:hypothetical protein n=1 Tax=Nostoc sp. TaxID=1180 RepID=UPI002FF5D5F8
MRLIANKSVFRLVGIWTFLLLLIFKGILPQPVYALLLSPDACAVKAECAVAIGLELAPTAKAAISKAQNEQVPNKAKEGYCSFYPLNLVCGPQGQSSVLYNYKFHQTVHYRRSGYPDRFVTHHYRSWRPVPGAIRSLVNQYADRDFGGGYPPSGDYVMWIRLNDGDGNNQTRGVVYEYSTGDTMTWDDYANYSNNNVEGEWISDVVRADI